MNSLFYARKMRMNAIEQRIMDKLEAREYFFITLFNDLAE